MHSAPQQHTPGMVLRPAKKVVRLFSHRLRKHGSTPDACLPLPRRFDARVGCVATHIILMCAYGGLQSAGADASGPRGPHRGPAMPRVHKLTVVCGFDCVCTTQCSTGVLLWTVEVLRCVEGVPVCGSPCVRGVTMHGRPHHVWVVLLRCMSQEALPSYPCA